MKFTVCVLLFVALFVGVLPTAQAQSTLNFVRQFQPSELQTTGFAVANASNADASVTFTLYSTSGTVIASATQVVPAAGQYAKLGSELFPGAATAGWVQATSAAPGLTGFWLSGDFSTFTDGAEAGIVAKTLLLPIATDRMEITVVNPGATANDVRIRLVNSDGTDGAPQVTQNLGGFGVFQAQASALFTGAVFGAGSYVSVTGDAGFSVSAVVRAFLVSTESAVLNGVEPSTSGSSLFFPHVINGSIGGSSYTTVIGVTNLGTLAQTVTLTFTPEPGGAPITVQRNLPPAGSLRETAQSIFGLGAGFQDGWVKVTSPLGVTGFVAYGDTVSGGLAVVPPQPTPRSSMLFAHVAGLPTWYTGIALLNASDTTASVEISVLTPAGSLIGSMVKLDIPAKHKTARLLGDLVPQANSQNGGFVVVRSSVPLFGLQLFGGTNGKILSNIASGRPGPTTATTTSVINTGGLGRLSISSIDIDTSFPHDCSASSGGGCATAGAGNRIIRIRFDLLDRPGSSVGQNEALGIYQAVTLQGTNLPSTQPFIIGAVQGPPGNVDSYVIISGGLNFALFAVPAAPPYDVVYVGFVVPANASAFKLGLAGQTLDLGF